MQTQSCPCAEMDVEERNSGPRLHLYLVTLWQIHLWASHITYLHFLPYFPYFEEIKRGLCDHLAVSVASPIIASVFYEVTFLCPPNSSVFLCGSCRIEGKYGTGLKSWELWRMQEVGIIEGTAVAATASLISNYYLRQNIQYVVHSSCVKLHITVYIKLTSVPVSLLKWYFAL
jgi:hypothetical protein